MKQTGKMEIPCNILWRRMQNASTKYSNQRTKFSFTAILFSFLIFFWLPVHPVVTHPPIFLSFYISIICVPLNSFAPRLKIRVFFLCVFSFRLSGSFSTFYFFFCILWRDSFRCALCSTHTRFHKRAVLFCLLFHFRFDGTKGTMNANRTKKKMFQRPWTNTTLSHSTHTRLKRKEAKSKKKKITKK